MPTVLVIVFLFFFVFLVGFCPTSPSTRALSWPPTLSRDYPRRKIDSRNDDTRERQDFLRETGAIGKGNTTRPLHSKDPLHASGRVYVYPPSTRDGCSSVPRATKQQALTQCVPKLPGFHHTRAHRAVFPTSHVRYASRT